MSISLEFIFSAGSYELDVVRNRKVQMFHSFGGPAKMIPIVETKCILLDADKVGLRFSLICYFFH